MMTDSRGAFQHEAHLTDAADEHGLWRLGHSFGGFRVVCPLASGGMAGVFLARKETAPEVRIHAALKLVHPHLALEREFVEMFLDEARIAASVNHPNVCRVFDFGASAGTYYLAMEYLEGETWSKLRAALAKHAEGRALLPSIAAHVIARACEGLHAAHSATDERGRPLAIVHRDVSPQNILIAYDGSVRVLDFGIARAADRLTITREGMRKGRFAYMSPEQVLDEPLASSSDVWSLGVVLREALEGRRVFHRANETATLLAITSEPLPPWRAGVPAALRAVADRALARSPNARYASASDMARDLTRFGFEQARPIDVAALSGWMRLLFRAELERKRALLQLPVPNRPGPSPKRRHHGRAVGSSASRVCALWWRVRNHFVRIATHCREAALLRRSKWAIGAALALLCGVVLGFATSIRSTRVTHDLQATRARPRGTVLVGFRDGWAEVYLNDRWLGTAPGRFVLPSGPQTLTIRPFGSGRFFSKQAYVRAGTVTHLLLPGELR